MPPVKRPMPDDDIVAALGRFQQRLGRADAGKAGRVVGQVDLGDGGMQADQHRVGLQPDGVVHDVAAAGDIEHLGGVDGVLDGGGVVGLAVALHAQACGYSPTGWSAAAAGSPAASGAGMAASGAASQRVPISPIAPGALQDQAVVEGLDFIDARLTPSVLPLSRKRANTGVFAATAFSKPIWV